MVRAVVVNREAREAVNYAALLRDAGYQVEICGGPGHDSCPVLLGLPCPLADQADVLIYDAAVLADPTVAQRLITDVRETYPDLPLVLTLSGPMVDWLETEGPHRVKPITDPDRLVGAVNEALSDQGMAV